MSSPTEGCPVCWIHIPQFIKDQTSYFPRLNQDVQIPAADLFESLLHSGYVLNQGLVLHILFFSYSSPEDSLCFTCHQRLRKYGRDIIYLHTIFRKVLSKIRPELHFLPIHYCHKKWLRFSHTMPSPKSLALILHLHLGFPLPQTDLLHFYLCHLRRVYENDFVSSVYPQYVYLTSQDRACRICLAILKTKSLGYFHSHLAHIHGILPISQVRGSFYLSSKKNYKWKDTFQVSPSLKQTLSHTSRKDSSKYSLRKRRRYYSREEEEEEPDCSKAPRILRSVKARVQCGYYKEYYFNDQSDNSDTSDTLESHTASSVSFDSDHTELFEPEVNQLDLSSMLPIHQEVYHCQFCFAKFDTFQEKLSHWPSHLGSTQGGFENPTEPKNVMVEDIESYSSMSLMDCKKDLTSEHLHRLSKLHENAKSSQPKEEEESSDASSSLLSSTRHRHGSTSSTRTSIDSCPLRSQETVDSPLAANLDHPPFHKNYWRHILKLKSAKALKMMCNKGKLAHFYKCLSRFCPFSTNDPQLFYKHCQEHKADSLPCTYCLKEYPPYQLLVHTTLEHSFRSFQCSNCFYRAGLKDLIENHHSLQHPNSRFSVLRCPMDYRVSILRHVFSTNSPKKLLPRKYCSVHLQKLRLPPKRMFFFICEQCGVIVPRERKHKHFQKYHSIKIMSATSPRKQIPTPLLIQNASPKGSRPMTSTPPSSDHSPPIAKPSVSPGMYQCKYCNYEGLTGVIVRKHCKLHHPNRPVMYKSPQVFQMGAPPRTGLARKPIIRSSVERTSPPSPTSPDSKPVSYIKTFTCHYCLESFTMYPYLFRHWKENHQHWKSRFRYSIEDVPLTPKTFRTLFHHPRSTTPPSRPNKPGKKMKLCNFCNEGFPNYSAKYRHMRVVHKLEPPFRMALKSPPLVEEELEPCDGAIGCSGIDFSKLYVHLPSVYSVKIPFESFAQAVNIFPKLLVTDAKKFLSDIY